MANSISGLNATLWAAEVAYAATSEMILGNIFNKVYQGSINAKYDTVKVPYIGTITGGLKTKGSAVSAEDVDDTCVSISINHQPYFMVSIEDIEQIQASIDLFQAYTIQGARTIATQTETQLLTNLNSIPSGQTVTVDATSGFAADLLDAVKLLNIAKAPQENRWAVLSPTLYNAVMALDAFQSAANLGDNSIVRTGQVGQIFGLNVVMHPLMNAAGTESCLVAHADWLAVVFQTLPVVRVSDYALNFAKFLGSYRLFGDAIIQPDFAVKLSYNNS